MPQSNITAVAKNPNKTNAPLAVDASGSLITGAGASAQYNLSAATALKTSAGRIAKVNVITAGTTVGTVNDCATTGAAAVANQIGSIPNTVGVISFDWPCATGIVVVPGTGQVISVSYS